MQFMPLSKSCVRPDAEPCEDLEDLYENAPCGYLSLRLDSTIFKSNATFAR